MRAAALLLALGAAAFAQAQSAGRVAGPCPEATRAIVRSATGTTWRVEASCLSGQPNAVEDGPFVTLARGTRGGLVDVGVVLKAGDATHRYRAEVPRDGRAHALASAGGPELTVELATIDGTGLVWVDADAVPARDVAAAVVDALGAEATGLDALGSTPVSLHADAVGHFAPLMLVASLADAAWLSSPKRHAFLSTAGWLAPADFAARYRPPVEVRDAWDRARDALRAASRNGARALVGIAHADGTRTGGYDEMGSNGGLREVRDGREHVALGDRWCERAPGTAWRCGSGSVEHGLPDVDWPRVRDGRVEAVECAAAAGCVAVVVDVARQSDNGNAPRISPDELARRYRLVVERDTWRPVVLVEDAPLGPLGVGRATYEYELDADVGAIELPE